MHSNWLFCHMRKIIVVFLCVLLLSFSVYNICVTFRYSFRDKKSTKKPAFPFYRLRHNVNCAKFFASPTGQVAGPNRMVVKTSSDHDTWRAFHKCDTVFHRLFYPKMSMTIEEEQYPLAFVILVNEHLEQLELFFNSIYAPQNVYCMHIDLKAQYLVHDALGRYAKCFDNILISNESYPVTNTGVNTIRAYMSCLRLLGDHRVHWKYALTLQGHDFPLRTNAELVHVLKLHNGANDVELLEAPEDRIRLHYDPVKDSQGFISSFKRSQNQREPLKGVTFYKGSVAAALSRNFVTFLMRSEELVNKMIRFLDEADLGDELFWSTLNHDSDLNAPGGYPGSCLAVSGTKLWISRFAVWQTYRHFKCSGSFRHTVCLFSLLDLNFLESRPELFLNKFWMPTDPLPLYCMHERLFNRTYDPANYPNPVSPSFYQSLSTVVYQKHKTSGSLNQFDCVVCIGSDCQH